VLSAAAVMGVALLAQFGGLPGSQPGIPVAPPTVPQPLPPPPFSGRPGVPFDLPHGQPAPWYGSGGTSDITASLTFVPGPDGWGASLGYERFIVNGIAPGLAVAYTSRASLDQLWLRASVRLVPLRLGRFGLAVTPEAAWVAVWGYPDGIAYGGSATAIFVATPNFGFEAGAEYFRFTPRTFADSVPGSDSFRPVIAVKVFI
jgi:hypothetical protein